MKLLNRGIDKRTDWTSTIRVLQVTVIFEDWRVFWLLFYCVEKVSDSRPNEVNDFYQFAQFFRLH
jgi:hypothetical protein